MAMASYGAHHRTAEFRALFTRVPVSYTHLDVYKRQAMPLEWITVNLITYG